LVIVVQQGRSIGIEDGFCPKRSSLRKHHRRTIRPIAVIVIPGIIVYGYFVRSDERRVWGTLRRHGLICPRRWIRCGRWCTGTSSCGLHCVSFFL
jgi:hypothetical protein